MSEKIEKKSLIQRFREFWQALQRCNLQKVFIETLEETDQFKQLVAKAKCQACGQQSLKLSRFERGVLGWEIEMTCGNCNFKGVVNSQGHKLEQIDSKGKARDKT